MKKVPILAVATVLFVINLVQIGLIAKAGEPVPSTPPGEMVVSVRIEGNQTITLDRILPKIRTRAQRPYLEEQVQEDIRELYKMGFTSVRCLKQSVPGGVAFTFQVAEPPLLKEVIVLGNNIFPTSTLKKESEVKVGDAADPYAVEEGCRRIEEYYKSHGHENVRVTIWDGDKKGDLRALFVVDEGPPRKAVSVNFVGNHAISSARLSPYSSAGERGRWQIDEDVSNLTNYYRRIGFFMAKVGREWELDEKQNSLKITFVIDEGPRYFVRNVSIRGNAKIDRGRLTEKLKLLSGQPFDQDQQDLDLHKLRDEYGGNGYVFAKVEADNLFPDEPAKLDIAYNIEEEGLRYRIGRIKIEIEGAGPQTQKMVLNCLSFKPGDIADTREFRASEERLKAAQSFRVEPKLGIEPKIVYCPLELEDDIANAGRRHKSDYLISGAAPLPPGEHYLDVWVRAEVRTPAGDAPQQHTP